MTEYNYAPGSQWGMRWARPPIPQKMPVPERYVHHTAGAVNPDPFAAFRQINEAAIRGDANSKPMSAGDYTLMVHYNQPRDIVTIGEMRGPWMPAATRDRNTVSKAVCLMGYFHPGHKLSRQPHPAELEGVARGLYICEQFGWTLPGGIIRGHRQNPSHPGATACPGDFLFQHMDTITARANELAAVGPLPAPTMWLAGVSATQAVLQWHPVAGAEHYHLRPSTVPEFITAELTATIPFNGQDMWLDIASFNAGYGDGPFHPAFIGRPK